MAHAVITDETYELIDVRYRGSVSVADRLDAFRQSLALLGGTGYRRLLIDYLDAQHQLGTFDQINAFASTISNDPVLRQCRIAFVGNRSQQFNATVETLADARRYPFQRFFDRTAALAWLLTDAPPIGLLRD